MIKAVIFDCFGVMLSAFNESRNEAMIEFVASLKGTYKTAMLSNVSGREGLDRRFHPGELDQLFDHVIASGDVGFEKPDPEIYEITLMYLGVTADEALFIDDIPRFCEAAEKVGLHAIRCVDIHETIQQVKEFLDAPTSES